MKDAWKAIMLGLFFPPAPLPGGPGIGATDTGKVVWSCDFESDYCGMIEQSKIEPDRRSYFVPIGRTGRSGIALVTYPGDDQVHGSDNWERDDLLLPPSPAYCNEGQEEWWGVSVLFPAGYTPSVLGTVMDFHHNKSTGDANFHVIAEGNELWFAGFAGDLRHPDRYYADIGPIVRNVWYDFVYHVTWSAGQNGSMEAWVNGAKFLSREGPTLYQGISCYVKLANYHAPNGYASAVVFDRLIRGTSAAAVSLTPLQ